MCRPGENIRDSGKCGAVGGVGWADQTRSTADSDGEAEAETEVSAKPVIEPVPQQSARPVWVVPTAVAAVGLTAIAAAVFVWRPWGVTKGGTSMVGATTTSAMVPAAIPTATTMSPTLPPPPPTFAASAIDSLMLTPADVYRITGGEFEGYPTGVPEIIAHHREPPTTPLLSTHPIAPESSSVQKVGCIRIQGSKLFETR